MTEREREREREEFGVSGLEKEMDMGIQVSREMYVIGINVLEREKEIIVRGLEGDRTKMHRLGFRDLERERE